jgi:cytoskeletal protein CcmA (bactofilin family)
MHLVRRVLVVAFLALLVLPFGAAAHAAGKSANGHSLGTIVVLNGRTTVAAGETASGVVVFHGRTIIAGKVNGSVVVFDGAVTVSGDVRDSLVVFRGHAEVTDGAHIGGDLVTNDKATVAGGARIDGERKHVSNFRFSGFSVLGRLLVWIAYTISVLILGLLLVALLPGPMESAARAFRSIGPSIGWGIALLIGLPLASILVLITLVGIPLGLSLMLALWFLFTVAYTVGVFAVGRLMVRPPRGRMKALLAGWAVLRVLGLIPIVGGLAWTAVTVIGLGSITVAVWRSRRAVHAADAAPAAPPPATGPIPSAAPAP